MTPVSVQGDCRVYPTRDCTLDLPQLPGFFGAGRNGATGTLTVRWASARCGHAADTGRRAASAKRLGGEDAGDFTGFQGPRSPEKGAVTPIRLATLPDSGPIGAFFEDGVPW